MNLGYRKAALKLHGMSETDREWTLQQLEEKDRSQLRQLIGELREMGIKAEGLPANDEGVSDTLSAVLAFEQENPELRHMLDVLQKARAQEVAGILEEEEPTMVAAVLSIYPWPWRGQLFQAWGVEARLRVQRAIPNATGISPRVKARLAVLVGTRVQACAHSRYELVEAIHQERKLAPRRFGAGRWLQGLRSWLL